MRSKVLLKFRGQKVKEGKPVKSEENQREVGFTKAKGRQCFEKNYVNDLER